MKSKDMVFPSLPFLENFDQTTGKRKTDGSKNNINIQQKINDYRTYENIPCSDGSERYMCKLF